MAIELAARRPAARKRAGRGRADGTGARKISADGTRPHGTGGPAPEERFLSC
jgi:hypothetical protein